MSVGKKVIVSVVACIAGLVASVIAGFLYTLIVEGKGKIDRETIFISIPIVLSILVVLLWMKPQARGCKENKN